MITATLSLGVVNAHAANLLQVYRQALKSDPVFQAERQNYLATTELYPQARAALLPNISLLGQSTYNDSSVKTSFVNFPGFTGKNTFTEHNLTLSLTQPVIDFASWFQLHVAKAQIRSGAARFAAAKLDLLIRTATAYFNVLQAEDILRFTNAEKRATYRQLDQAKQRYNVGLDAVTSVYDAQAQYDSIVAREIQAKNDVENAREDLRQITGVYYRHLARLKDRYPLVMPSPANVEQWVEAAGRQNYAVQAARLNAVAARETIKVNFSGHLPTVDVIGQYNSIRTNNSGIGSPGDRDQTYIGGQVNLPIYTGGLISSQTQQAKYEYQQALYDLETAYREVIVNTRQVYNDIINGISKIKADRQVIISRKSSLDSTEAALNVGTRTMVDLLIAVQQLFEAQSNYSIDQYAYIINMLNLKQLEGTLSVQDFKAVNRWLTNAPPPKDVIYSEGPTGLPAASTVQPANTVQPPLMPLDGTNTNTTTSSSPQTKPTTDQKTNTSKSKSEQETKTKTEKTKPKSSKTDQTKTDETKSKKSKQQQNNDLNISKAKQHQHNLKRAKHEANHEHKAKIKTHLTAKPAKHKPVTEHLAHNKVQRHTTEPHRHTAKTNKQKDFYALQLLASHTKTKLERYTKQHGLTDKNIYYQQSNIAHNQHWYELLYGRYPNEHAAKEAIKLLPKSLQKLHPWVRRVEAKS